MADETTPGDEPPAEQPKYDQAFFLALAAKGRDAWNAWRRDPANKDVRVTFAGVDFSVAPRDEIDFSGFEFGDDADFSGCKWRGVSGQKSPEGFAPGRACFTGATFGSRANFTSATFGAFADFTGAAFGACGDFTGAAFGLGASFTKVSFLIGANFTGAFFHDWANFTRTIFDGAFFTAAAFGFMANFTGANFATVSFTGTAFGGSARFDDAIFRGQVRFTGQPSEKWARGRASVHSQGKEPHLALQEYLKEFGAGPDRFLSIYFANARFDYEADFSGRSFDRAADFTNVRFYYPPDFDAATNLARIDFTGAYIGFGRPFDFHWTSETIIPVRLRRLRRIAEDTKNHDLERDLYIEERKAERGVYLYKLLELDELKKKLAEINEQKDHTWLGWWLRHRAHTTHCLRILEPAKLGRLIGHLLWIGVMGIYWALADYGRSFARPAAWLVSSGFFFYWCYGKILAPLMAKAPDIEKYKQAVRMLALGNTVPFVGPLTIDGKVKEFLFCPNNAASCLPPIPPEGFQFLVIGQNLFSITCVFFIGLALRNYFKIK